MHLMHARHALRSRWILPSSRTIDEVVAAYCGRLSALASIFELTRLDSFTLSHCGSRAPLPTLKPHFTALVPRLRTDCLLGFVRLGLSPNCVFNAELAHSLDSTLITLCLSLFNWAKYRRHKGGIKVHTILNNDSLLPEVMVMTDGKISDITMARSLQLPTNQCILIMDRGYSDYEFFVQLDEQATTFVTRLKEGAVTTPLKKGVIKEFDGKDEKWGDYCIQFVGQQVDEKVKQKNFRLIQWYDAETDRWFDFVTNDWEHSAKDIAWLYRDRWEIEKFFRPQIQKRSAIDGA